MNKRPLVQAMLLVCALLLCCCAASQKQGEQKALPMNSTNSEEKQAASNADWRRLYEAAKSQSERRAVCLRAIDEGAIHRGVAVSAIDEIFGTRLASEPRSGNEAIRQGIVRFADQIVVPPGPSGKVESGVGYVGWYLALDYDRSGAIQNYYLTNLHKGMSSYEKVGKTLTVAELKQLYEAAKSESERRAVCLRAIDEGVIQVYGRGRVSTLDEIFGTRLASDLPTKKEREQKAAIDFSPAAPGPDNSRATANAGWFLAVEYDYNGDIANYYLTNLHK
jgi:hypothetical protein